jgi:hypothetical protein
MTCFGKSSGYGSHQIFFDRMSTRSLGRFGILRFGGAGVFESIESGIAINAAERTDLDCAEKILL